MNYKGNIKALKRVKWFMEDRYKLEEDSVINEKALLAEKNLVFVRALVILVNTLAFVFMDKSGNILWLAWTIIGVSWIYSLYLIVGKPYQKFPVVIASGFSFGCDALIITCWIAATGYYDSPFYTLYYLSIVSVAFRFNSLLTLLSSFFYCACYLQFNFWIDNPSDVLTLLFRSGYVFIFGFLGTVINRETFEQVSQRMKKEIIADKYRNAAQALKESETKLRELNLNLERKVDERTRELKESLKRFESLINSIPNLAWIITCDGHTTYVNKSWLEFNSMKMHKRFLSWDDHIFEEDKAFHNEAWLKSLVMKSSFEAELRWEKGSDELRWMLVRANPVKNENGDVILWIGSATDIHEQKLMEQRKDTFIGMASHELKTPLTSAKAYLQLAAGKLRERNDVENESFLRKSEESIKKLSQLIADLLDLSKIQSGKLEYNMVDIDFDKLVINSVENVAHAIQGYNVVMEGETGCKIQGDPIRLEQVITNLLTNAAKYSPGTQHIEVRLKNNSDHVVCTIKDFGIGIPRDKISNIFDRFYRVSSGSAKTPGLGIGLFITAEIVKKHNGKIWVESEPQKGSLFHFSIPVNNNQFPDVSESLRI